MRLLGVSYREFHELEQERDRLKKELKDGDEAHARTRAELRSVTEERDRLLCPLHGLVKRGKPAECSCEDIKALREKAKRLDNYSATVQAQSYAIALRQQGWRQYGYPGRFW